MTTDENPTRCMCTAGRPGRSHSTEFPYSAPHPRARTHTLRTPPPATAAVSRATALRGPRRRTPGAHAAAFALRHYGTRSGALKTAGHMHAHARCARARLAISEPF